MNERSTTGPSMMPEQAANGTNRGRRTRYNLLAAAAVTVCGFTACDNDQRTAAESVVGAATSTLDQPGSSRGEIDPATLISEYRIAYNSADIERIMALFTDDSVVVGHPLQSRSEGLAAIRSLQRRDLARAAPVDAYVMSRIDVAGDTVTWDHRFTNAHGDRWCADGNRAVVSDGKILNWTFAHSVDRCEK